MKFDEAALDVYIDYHDMLLQRACDIIKIYNDIHHTNWDLDNFYIGDDKQLSIELYWWRGDRESMTISFTKEFIFKDKEELQQAMEDLYAAEAERERQEKEARRQKAEKEQEERERKEYERLQKKFGDTK